MKKGVCVQMMLRAVMYGLAAGCLFIWAAESRANSAAPMLSCNPDPGSAYSLCELKAQAQACPRSPFWQAYFGDGGLSILNEFNPKILLHLAKTGLLVNFDPTAAQKGIAVYDPEKKVLLLPRGGRGAVWEAAHAVDDALMPDNAGNVSKAADMIAVHPSRDSWKNYLDVQAATASAEFLESANSFQYFKAYAQYVRQRNEQDGLNMDEEARTDSDLTQPRETYMYAFKSYLYRDSREDLIRHAPLLYAWVKSSLTRFIEKDDMELFKARFDSSIYWSPDVGSRQEADALKKRVISRMNMKMKGLPEFSTLDDYCTQRSDPFDPRKLLSN